MIIKIDYICCYKTQCVSHIIQEKYQYPLNVMYIFIPKTSLSLNTRSHIFLERKHLTKTCCIFEHAKFKCPRGQWNTLEEMTDKCKFMIAMNWRITIELDIRCFCTLSKSIQKFVIIDDLNVPKLLVAFTIILVIIIFPVLDVIVYRNTNVLSLYQEVEISDFLVHCFS